MNPDFTLIWPLSCPKDGDHFSGPRFKVTLRVSGDGSTRSWKPPYFFAAKTQTPSQ